MSKSVVFDIDGTLADTAWRQHYVQTKPKNWKAWNAGIPHDPPHSDMIWLLRLLSEPCQILLASGRSEDYREDTIFWLSRYGVPYDKLYMRKTGDNRKDSIVKTEILKQMQAEGHNIFMVFDDRDQVVKAWRDAGIRCLQVREGNF